MSRPVARGKTGDRESGVRIIFSGAGTGGHLFPGIALASALNRISKNAEILFLITGRKLEAGVLDRYGFAYQKIKASGIKGKGLFEKFSAVFRVFAGLLQFSAIVREFSPDIVIGMGGYASAPAVIGARLLGIPCAICEQNRIPGLTNRVLSRFAERIYTAFPDTSFKAAAFRTVYAGNPVRAEIIALSKMQKPEKKNSFFTILILGGSQGAHAVNMAVMNALVFLDEKDRYFFIHQTGPADAGKVRDAYEKFGFRAEVKPFFDDMGVQYTRADLVVCRAGATTIAELTVFGLPALFIPLPSAADNHQVLNARFVVEKGGAEMIEEKELTGGLLAGRIRFYAEHEEILSNMGRAAARLGKPDAAEKIAEDIMGSFSR